MYTLEDDQETSARLRKGDFTGALPPGQDQETTDNDQPASPPAHPGHATPLTQLTNSFAQITNSFKKITTPGKAHAADKKVALAALTIACICVFFTALDQTVVVTALPQIVIQLQIPLTQLDHAAWIISAYLLGFVIAMPLMGRVSDMYGRRRIFLLCLTIFGIGSVFCGLAPTLGQTWDLGFLNIIGIDTSSPGLPPGLVWLIAARFVQAIGGGAIIPVSMAIAGDFYGQERRALALGIIGAVTEAGGVLGPLYGAVIVQHLGWEWIFFLNAPLVIGLTVGAWFLIPRGTRQHERIDWIGAALLGLALTCLSLGLAQQGTDLGPTTANSGAPQNNPISLALAVVFLIAFILVERKVRWPVVDLSLFKRFPFSASSLVSLLVGAALIIAMADIPIFVNTVLRNQIAEQDLPLVSGLALLRLTAMIPIGALLGGWLCSRISCRFTGVLGLLFTAAGFFLMSRWPLNVDWNQITISTVTTGLGFGLVIAPIGTTAINAVKAKQAGVGSAVVTALRMVGMMLGLAALTSWALAYFKQLASTYPSLPVTATADQFKQWSEGYATHLIRSAHTVYSAVFFTTMVLCLIAIVPALFLWGRKQPETEAEVEELSSVNLAATGSLAPDAIAAADAPTVPAPAPTGPLDTQFGLPPVPPIDNQGKGKGWRDPKHRRMVIAIASVTLVVLLILAGVIAAFSWQSSDTSNTSPGSSSRSNATNAATATAISGPRMIQLAMDGAALTSIFVKQLGLQGTLTDVKITPTPNDGLILSMNLHIDSSGIHRVLPVELDTTISVDKQQNIQLHILHLKRDGIDAGATAAASMQTAMNKLLVSSVMPALRDQLKGAKLISVHTSTSIVCGGGSLMFVMLIQAPPIEGVAAQPTPISFCFKGPIDVNKLLPH
jgi:MFS family permease